MKRRDVGVAAIVFLLVALSINPGIAIANPYLAKPGEPTVRARIGACAVTGGFIHLYSALDNQLFEKYGLNAGEHRRARRRRGAGGFGSR